MLWLLQVWTGCCPLLNVCSNEWQNFFLKFVQHLFLEYFFVSLDKFVLFHHKMLKFAETLILMCGKIFSAFYSVLHEPFSNSYGFPLMQEFNPFCSYLALYDRKHFCSFLTDLSSLSFLFHQKFPLVSYDVKNVLTKQFPKMQKQPFANVLWKQSSRYIL